MNKTRVSVWTARPPSLPSAAQERSPYHRGPSLRRGAGEDGGTGAYALPEGGPCGGPEGGPAEGRRGAAAGGDDAL
ncbi:MAG: hypothetical protein LBW77_06030 [Verrucomicrobiota bacterium]|nr:hypothetical protein [Verrucomicrobiota bacterium]